MRETYLPSEILELYADRKPTEGSPMKLSAKEWQDHVSQQQQSGLSLRAYSKLHGLGEGNLHYWRQKRKVAPSAFVPVAVKPQTPVINRLGLAVRLPNGIELLFDSAAASVTELVQSLMRVRP